MATALRIMLCAGLAAACAVSALAQQDLASFSGDTLQMCGGTYTPHEALKPPALMLEVAPDVALSQYGPAYRKLESRLRSALSEAEQAMPKVPQFLANLVRADQDVITVDDFTLVRKVGDPRVLVLLQSSPADQLEIVCRKEVRVPQYLVNIVTVANVTARIKTNQLVPAFEARATAVARQARDVDNLLKRGLPMWPWELWANGKRLPESDAEPLFRSQWVLLRPTAGMAVDTRSRADGDLQASVGIEPVGFIRYRGDDYSKWWGASLLVTTSSKSGVGLGGLLRWNNFVLGATRNQGQQAGQSDSTVLFIGVDLYEYLNKHRAAIGELGDAEQRLKEMGERLLKPN